jgi:hypothetical protein
MEFGNVFFDRRDTDASQALKVLVLYDDLAAGQRAMHLCWELTRQRESDLSLQRQLWRLDLVCDPVCGGFAIADALTADLLIISISSQSELSQSLQQSLRSCLARKRDTGSAIVGLLGTDHQINGAELLNLQLLRSMAQEAGLEFFAPFGNVTEALKNGHANVEAKLAEQAPVCLGEPGLLAVQQVALAHRPTMLQSYGRDTNYRDWGINE